MRKEEQVLFPIMQAGAGETLRVPIARIREEHEAEGFHIREIEHITHGLSLPQGACNSWRALYAGMTKFADDLVTHIYLENTKLFPMFE
nr:iron-sulfur cluster repair di-iron protein [Rhizobium sp. Khangiran2]